MIQLRQYQKDALDAIARELAAGRNRLLIQMATGLGKTALAASVLRDAPLLSWLERFPERDRRVLFFAHRDELIDQSADTFQRLNPGLMVSIEQGPRRANRYSDVVIASVQTLAASKYRRLHDLIRYRPFRLVFCDEAHRAASPSYRTAFVHLGFLPPADASDDEDEEIDVNQLAAHLAGWDAVAPKDRLLIGLTATPNRSDGVGLGAVFQSIAFTFPLRKGVEAGYLVPIKPWVIDTVTSLDGVRVNRGDFNQGDLQKAVNVEDRNRRTVAGWAKFAHGRPTIAFTSGVQHAADLAECYRSQGVSAAMVSGDTPKDERRQILDDYRTGRLTVLTNAQVFTEGTDLPLTSCIVMAKPTKSALTYEQCVGRGLRLHPGKENCVLIDVVDIARKHSLMTAPTLYGLPPGLISDKGKNLSELAEAWDAFADAHPGLNVEKLGRVAIEQLQVKASTFNVWEIASLGTFGAGRAMNWVKTAAETFRLQYPWQDGTEVIAVSPDLLGRYEVVCTFRPAVGPVRQRTLAGGFETSVIAADFAERFVATERGEVNRIVQKGARWRTEPATSRQINWLRWKGISIRPGLTKGEAADLRDLHQAKVGL